MNTPYFTLTNDTRLTFAGSADRYHKNIAAIRLLRDLQKQERRPHGLLPEGRVVVL